MGNDGMNEVLIHLRQAAHRGEIDAAMFLRLCEVLLAQGQTAPVLAVLQERGMLPHLVSTAGSSVELHSVAGLDSSRSGSWINAELSSVGQPPPVDDVLARVEQLRALKIAESRPPDKYEIVRELARGGVGCIHVARDRDLMRTLVMKTLIEGHKVSDYVLKKFVEEAQITGQLEHPNIVPVHDFGYFSGGEVFFTMKLVKGRTLKDIIKRLRKPEDAEPDPFGNEVFTRTRLLQIFLQVCMAIGFAHSRRVVHRDIKPSNVMLGDFGETLVLDWGVAKVLGRKPDPSELQGPNPLTMDDDQVSTMRSQAHDETMMGVVTGTPAYMAPEQAAGKIDEVDARSDIYALGALLYEILCYVPPFRGKNFRQTLLAVITQPVIPPSERAPQNEIPRALEEICLRCLQKRREDRYQSCREIVADLERYLAGVEDLDRRARLSREKVDEGRGLLESFKVARAQAEGLRAEVAEIEWQVQGFEPVEVKRPLWTRQAALAEAEGEAHRLFGAAAQAFMAAIGFDPQNDDGCNELARLYWIRLREAERQNDEANVIYYRGLVAAYNRGLFDEQLRGEGRIILRSDPPGAQVDAARFAEVDLQLTTLMDERLPPTPLNNDPLAQGSWLLTLTMPGYRDVRCPVQIDRGEVTDVAVRFFREEEIGDHYLYVPAGAFTMGGDEACATARHRRVVPVGDLFVARYPVTCAEYLAFLNDLCFSAPDEALLRSPRLKAREGFLWSIGADGRFALPAVDGEGFRWEPYWPVFGISYDDAVAYCAWHTGRVGVAVRLPREEEWEKAARGPDGRLFPWGSRFDATFCKMAASRPGRPAPESVGSFPADCSPYGVFDLAGLVSEYCDSPFGADPALRVVRGGHYATPNEMACRVTHRAPVPTDEPSLTCGFRLVRDPPVAQVVTQRRLIRPQFL
jgi:serine/threonine-protein kinase